MDSVLLRFVQWYLPSLGLSTLSGVFRTPPFLFRGIYVHKAAAATTKSFGMGKTRLNSCIAKLLHPVSVSHFASVSSFGRQIFPTWDAEKVIS